MISSSKSPSSALAQSKAIWFTPTLDVATAKSLLAFPQMPWARSWAKHLASPSFKNKPCKLRSLGQASHRTKRIASGARLQRLRNTETSANFMTALSKACERMAMRMTLPSGALPKSKGSGPMVSLKATPQALPFWSMQAHGSNAITLLFLHAPSSTHSPWGSMRQHKSSEMRENTASPSALSA